MLHSNSPRSTGLRLLRARSALAALACIAGTLLPCSHQATAAQPLQAGAANIDVTPQSLPVIQNGGFLEAQATRIEDPLHARCLILADDDTMVAIVVVDSCMLPLDVCDSAKALASKQTGIPVDRMLISATHTHSAPSVMDYCLGSRADPAYREWLPGQIARAVVEAKSRMQPVQVGWRQIDANPYTKCRRWITRTDKLLDDPFGATTVHAQMHPGPMNSEYCGPSGPIDPWFSLLAVQTLDGKPVAILANLAMHYYGGHDGVSADYFGRFSDRLAARLRPEEPDAVVVIMSQGCSGDAWWGDYFLRSDRQRFQNIDQFTDGLVDLGASAYSEMTFSSQVPLEMAEQRMMLHRRTPDPDRLAWARNLNAQRGDRLPQNQPEVYAVQAVYLDEHPEEEVVLQGVRLGELGIVGMPNEVYALSGLKVREQSPLPFTIPISLANGASGYIPPPEQHALGGYTTWPARTAGLEVQAEPKIVEGVLQLLEKASSRARRVFREAETPYSQAVMASKPATYWRLGELQGPEFFDASGNGGRLSALGWLAYHLPGREGDAYGQAFASHAVQLAGGKLVASELEVGESYTIELFFYLGTPNDFRDVTGTLFQRGEDQLVVTGNGDAASPHEPGRLQAGGLVGRTTIAPHRWHHLVFVRNGEFLAAYLDDAEEPEFSGKQPLTQAPSRTMSFGGGEQDAAPWEGKLDELAVFERALLRDEIRRHFRAETVAGRLLERAGERPALASEPLDAEASRRAWRVRDGYRIELVAAEPLVLDPVAIDWGFDGRLWVAEMADYPMGMDGVGKPGGRIRWLKDSDGDGVYDASQVFLEGIGFPNGVMAWGDGVLVTAAPEIFFADDTDGDGRADRCETLFSGFVAGNQQLRVNGLRWGIDNWIYCASGSHHAGFGAETSLRVHRSDEQVVVGSRDFRFRPDFRRLEPESGPSQFGRVRDDWGNWFGVQNSQPLWHYVLADRYLRRNLEIAPIDPRQQVRRPPMPRVYAAQPPQKRYIGFDHAGHYTSACGISIYRDNHLFADAETTYAFTCEPFHNLVQRHAIRRQGVSFTGDRADDGAFDFLASTDSWTRPVMTRTGPDGALWVVDMYRYMIEHPEFLTPQGREEMSPGYRAGETMGRIYRVVDAARGVARPLPQIHLLAPLELVRALDSPNGEVRDLVHRRLLQIVSPADLAATANALRRLMRDAPRAETQLQAIGVLDGLGSVDADALLEALENPHPDVRRFTIVLAEEFARSAADRKDFQHKAANRVQEKLVRMVDDDDAAVRLQLACSLGEWSAPEAGAALAQLARRANGDAYLTAGVISSAGTHYEALVDYAVQHRAEVSEQLIVDLMEMGPSRREAMGRLLEAFVGGPSDAANAVEQPVDRTPAILVETGGAPRVSRWLDSLAERGENFQALNQNAATSDRLDEAISRLEQTMDQVRAWLARQKVSDPLPNERDDESVSEHTLAALSLLGRQPERGSNDVRLALSLLRPQWSSNVQRAALGVLGRLDPQRVDTASGLEALWTSWGTLLPETRTVAVDILIARPRYAQTLVQMLGDAKGPVTVQDLDLVQRQRLLQSSDQEIAGLAEKAFHSQAFTSREESRAAQAAARTLLGDVGRGAKIFQQHCAVCHDMTGKPLVGPDLRGVTSRRPDALLTAILDPSQTIEPRFQNYLAVLKSGETVQGLIVHESAQALEFAMADGTRRTVLRGAIDDLQRSPVSLMPNGFETKLDPQSLADVAAYVADLDRPQEN